MIFPTARKVLPLLTAQTVVLFLALFNTAARAESFTFETLPASGNVDGPAGSTVGWGYSITNQSLTDWLVTTSVNAGSFLNGTPLSLFDFPTVAPRQNVNILYDALNGFGLYELTWDAAAPVGFINSGNFVLSAEWWTGDPLFGGSLIAGAPDQSVLYTATVTAAPVPVPSTVPLLSTGLAAIALLRRSARRA
ncbi:MAG TPA: PEP-CTERM sorting domain-containing protein [Terriglobia bacterium]|nr:PEP-CTERM sorting domain-containing protein [Terriglobia bacterium]